ncbi:SDR family NAD(P)-dependent oxidoreductase [Paraburkholderia sp. UYCP14C]|uniref:SDR family NAD(P)-dependent oxidoreductase n=1 Tax=Paraburkholderia sp. UYCP14C TaxID=2511130 RepID=UPI0020071D3B|nr:SDR family NAD(P)-dependent oxidoreductase [Paraburkholderia sp. UYCP14C]
MAHGITPKDLSTFDGSAIAMAVPQLEDKWVLVTGAGSGIGRATAMAFARRGARLVIADNDPEALDEVGLEIAGLRLECIAFRVDVADEAAMLRFARAVHVLIGAVDVLINNAGIGYLGPFLYSPLESWRRVLDINVMGVVHGCHVFGQDMVNAGGARQIVNVASLAGIAPAPNMSAYAASKHAVMGLSDVLSMELADTEVGVTAVCPGIINTPITTAAGAISSAISLAQADKLRAYYETNGASPDVVAQAIVDAVRSGRSLVLVGPYAKRMYHLKRLSRALTKALTISDARKNGYL